MKNTINTEGIATFANYIISRVSSGILEFTTFLIAFFAPTGLVLAAVGFAVLLDTIFGRWRAKNAPREGEIVTSKITRIGLVNKSIGYMLVVLGVFLMDKAFMNEFMSMFTQIEYILTKAAGLIFCWVEYSSMNESYKAVKNQSIGQAIRNFLRAIKIVKEDIGQIKKKDNDGQ